MIRDRSIVALLSGELVSRLGSQFTSLALPWFVLVTTGSTSKMGLVFAAELAPIALLGIPSTALVMRLGPKRWMILLDAARVPITAVVPFLHAVGGLSYAVILAAAVLHGTFSCGYFTSQRLVLPAVVGEDEQRLVQANGLVEGTTNATNKPRTMTTSPPAATQIHHQDGRCSIDTTPCDPPQFKAADGRCGYPMNGP